MKKIFLPVAFAISISAAAQDSTLQTKTGKPLTFSGCAETYYSYDFNTPIDNNRPFFLYNYNRHNEFNVNLAFVKASYNTEKVRANVALAAGTYMNANYSAEPGVLKNIYEANAGFKLSNDKNLWLDVGILTSHIGFESAVGKDNWCLTRSLVAENSPYFESGAKLSYTTGNGNVQLALLALNGWQRISRVSGNSLMSWGTQVYVKPTHGVTLNYSNFIGTDKPDSARQWRIYHNLYGIFQFNDKAGLTLGFDIGTEQVTKGSNRSNTWYTPVAILRITPNSKWAFALRGEYFSDENGVIIATGSTNGFKTTGFSFNADRYIGSNFLWRIEFRTFSSKDGIFMKDSNAKKNNSAVTTAMALSF